jgi:hypothetical protein
LRPAFRKSGKKCPICLKTGLFYPVFGIFGCFFVQASGSIYGMALEWFVLFNTFTVSLVLAKQQQCLLLTGDMALRKAAIKEQVDVKGTLWVNLLRSKSLPTKRHKPLTTRCKRKAVALG